MEDHCGGLVSVLSSTLSAPLRVALAPLWTIFLVPRLILPPAFLVALAVSCAASFVSCLRPPVSDCANAPSESRRANTNAHKILKFIFTSVLWWDSSGQEWVATLLDIATIVAIAIIAKI